jgi:putative Mn2+ efflux pump MntP
MIRAGLHQGERAAQSADLTRGWNLVGFSLAVSLDALAVGISLPAAQAPIALSVTTFGIMAAGATVVAMRLAASIGARVGGRAEIVAGCVLVAIGLKILNDHIHFLPIG